MIKMFFSSFFRTIGRIIAYLVFGALLALIFQNSDVFAADLGITTNSGYSQYACDCGVSSCRYCTNNTTTSKVAFGTTADNPGQIWFGGAYLFYGSSNFLSTNSYTITYKTSFVDMPDTYVEDLKKDLNSWDYIINGYVNSTVGYSDSYVNDFKCSTKFDTTTTNTFITTCNVNLNTNVSRLQVKVTYWDRNTESGDEHYFYYSPKIKSTFVSITYSEGVGAQIDNQTIVIQQQTDKLNNSINNMLSVLQQDSDKMEDIYLDDTENADGTCNGIICNLKKVVKSVINLPVTLINAIIDALKSLFIPDNFDFINDFKDSIESKLGFIAEIPIDMINFLFLLGTNEWNEMDSISFPEIEIFGYKFWDSQTIDLTEAINIFKPFKYITDILCVIICINTMAKWRDKFTGGGN